VKLLIVGAGAPTGKALVALLRQRKIPCQILDEKRLGGGNLSRAQKLVASSRADQVINLASFKASSQLAVFHAEQSPSECQRVNFKNSALLAGVCERMEIPLIQLSSPYVFDGEKKLGYNELDQALPLGVYGRTVSQGEQAVAKIPRHIILRSGWIFGVSQRDQLKLWIQNIKKQAGVLAVMRRRFSPTPVDDLARVLLAVCLQVDCQANVWGTYHYCGLETKKENEFLLQILKYASQHDEGIYQLLDKVKLSEVQASAPEVPNTTLACKKIFDTFGIKQRSWHGSLQTTIRSLYHELPQSAAGTETQITSTHKVLDLH
jgi:dTDP-4-dehydrorhamnose reductase